MENITDIFRGRVADLYAQNSKIKPEISSLCKDCEKRAQKAKGWSDDELQEAKNKAINTVQKAVEE